ncbi:MerR family transcriptional regulator [Bacillus sp. JCM 19034]|uniref:MerR family transcriptional regulator n=1 Tax=Bacillus sp. JCM 19034 TaxID=1481928 RepID=UPI0007860943|nr:MerR family transcriptional regulator [Bacillus sp. JCM 19034]
MEKLYSIQEVSRILGISKDTLRYYDRIGIVSPSREENRYRRYSKEDLIDLMNIQIMQYADFSLDEIKDKLIFHKMDNSDPAYYKEVAEFLDAKNAEIRRKVAHLKKASRLLDVAAATLRDFNNERDQTLTKIVREIYKDIQKGDVEIPKEGCGEHQN